MNQQDEEKSKRVEDEIQDFIPTRKELLQLGKYWFRRGLELDLAYFYSCSWGSSDSRLWHHAINKVSEIEDLLGKEEVDKSIDEVIVQFRRRFHDNMRLWQIFQRGSEAQWHAVRDEYQRCFLNGPDGTEIFAFNPKMELTSSSFEEMSWLPGKHVSRRLNITPPLAWSAPPDETRSLAITMDRTHSFDDLTNHWILFNIPSDVRELPMAIPADENLPDGSAQGKNDYQKIGYYGPDSTWPIQYDFHVYALDKRLDLKAGVSKDELLDEMICHILDEGHLSVLHLPTLSL